VRRIALVVSLVVASACGSDAAEFTLGPTDANVVGTFALTNSNGHVLPIVARLTLDEEWDMTSDQLIIRSDLTWSETSTYKVTTLVTGAISTQQTASSGTYSISDNKINFVMTVGGSATYTGSVSGNTLTMIYNGGHFIYTRSSTSGS
jgi:hypothetical protein